MNLMKTTRALAAIAFATLGFSSTSQAAVNAFFSAGSTCTGATSALFSPAGPTVQVSLCMTTTSPTATCGHTIVLQSAVGESGKFVVNSPVILGAGYSDPNSEVAQLPLAINNPPIVADLGGTGSAAVASAGNQLLATFNLAPQASATNPSYVISLNNVSIAAVDADGTCGVTVVPSELPLTASFTLNRNNAPVFTSVASTTFSTTSANTFAVTATGNPTPTITAGTLPAGVSFTSGGANSGTGTLSTAAGSITAGGPYTITFTAAGSTSVPQSFTLNVAGQASQTINFSNPGTQVFSSTPFALSATASSTLPVTFSTQTPSICTVFNGNLTMVTLGTCTISANQAGNATYLPAQTSQSFGIVGSVPGAPTGVTGTPGNTQAVIAFTAPTSTGGLSISNYTATCSGGNTTVSASATSSPITVTGLVNATVYACTVTATNSLGTGSASTPPTNVTPNNVALSLISVKSRKVHGLGTPTNPFVTYDLTIDTLPAINGLVTTEPRNVGGGHQIVFKFNNPITVAGTATTVATDRLGAAIASPAAAASFTAGSDEVIVTLSSVLDMSRVTITLAGVNTTGPNAVASLGFLVADMNNNRVVNSGDVVGAAVRSGIPLDQTNFRFDFNLNGLINSGDIVGAAVRSGNGI